MRVLGAFGSKCRVPFSGVFGVMYHPGINLHQFPMATIRVRKRGRWCCKLQCSGPHQSRQVASLSRAPDIRLPVACSGVDEVTGWLEYKARRFLSAGLVLLIIIEMPSGRRAPLFGLLADFLSKSNGSAQKGRACIGEVACISVERRVVNLGGAKL